VVVVVSGTEIQVNGQKVATVSDVLAQESDVVEPLKLALDQLQSSHPLIRPDNELMSKRVTIMGDREIPYRLLRKIMVTSARANFSDVSFAVRQRLES
jgi:biopolymer transport protein ExbD